MYFSACAGTVNTRCIILRGRCGFMLISMTVCWADQFIPFEHFVCGDDTVVDDRPF